MKSLVMLSMISALLAAALIAQAHADGCDSASLSRGNEAQAQIETMVKQALSDALASKQIPVETSRVELTSQNSCYRDSNNVAEYQILVQAKVTTARGNVLELYPLVYNSNGSRTLKRYDNEGAPLSDETVLDFYLDGGDPTSQDQGYSGWTIPLTNVATQVNVVDDMQSIPSFRSSLTIIDTQ